MGAAGIPGVEISDLEDAVRVQLMTIIEETELIRKFMRAVKRNIVNKVSRKCPRSSFLDLLQLLKSDSF